jgi:hypothetical protein
MSVSTTPPRVANWKVGVPRRRVNSVGEHREPATRQVRGLPVGSPPREGVSGTYARLPSRDAGKVVSQIRYKLAQLDQRLMPPTAGSHGLTEVQLNPQRIPSGWRRIPSNFTSTAQSPPAGTGPVRASIGATKRGMSSCGPYRQSRWDPPRRCGIRGDAGLRGRHARD